MVFADIAIALIDEGILAILVFYLLHDFRKTINSNTLATRELTTYLRNNSNNKKRR